MLMAPSTDFATSGINTLNGVCQHLIAAQLGACSLVADCRNLHWQCNILATSKPSWNVPSC